MAEIEGLVEEVQRWVVRKTWTGLANGDTGDAFEGPWASASVQVTGTFGIGGEVTIQGSNDGTTWATLNDVEGAAAVITVAGLIQIAEKPLMIRPEVTAGDGATDLNVILVSVRE